MTTILIHARNNADARRMGAHQTDIPCASVRHLGRKVVLVATDDLAATIEWLNESWLVDSYSVEH